MLTKSTLHHYYSKQLTVQANRLSCFQVVKSLQMDYVCPAREAGSEAGSPSHNYHHTQLNTLKLPGVEAHKLSISLQSLWLQMLHDLRIDPL